MRRSGPWGCVVVLGLEGGSELDAGLEERAGFADRLEGAVERGWPGAVAVAEESVVLATELGHLRSDGVGGQFPGLFVEGVDLVGDGEVLVGDGAVGDLGVAQGHVHAAVAEHRGDRLERHASVDRLGGEGMPELVGVDVGEPGCGAGLVDEPGDGVPVQRPAVLPRQQQRVFGRDVRVR